MQINPDLLNVEEIGVNGVHSCFMQLLPSEGQQRLLPPLFCYELAGQLHVPCYEGEDLTPQSCLRVLSGNVGAMQIRC